jgi:hypothetical protein
MATEETMAPEEYKLEYASHHRIPASEGKGDDGDDDDGDG